MAPLTAIVIGSAAGGGFPQWNCRCPVCELAWAGDPRVRPLTQAALAVASGEGPWTLINASPDLREQIQATPALQPRGLRQSPIAAVVLTGGEIDQIAGLLSLREMSPFTLFATHETHAAVASNTMFSAIRLMSRETVALDEPFALPGGLTAELFAVPGKAPLYLEADDPVLDAAGEGNTGIELRTTDKRLVFVPGASAVTPAMRARFMRADAILFDGTLYTDDEMQKWGVGEKTGRRMGHMPIAGPDGTLAALRDIEARRIFVHINNTNPILVAGSAERGTVEAAGWEIAQDGMEIVL
jgi:pyrroloquinoline quinone biosynthesis protein B